MIQGLKGFIRLSARDNFTLKYVEKNTGKKCELVLDPTLLNPYFGSTGEGGENYILVYESIYRRADSGYSTFFSRNRMENQSSFLASGMV